MESSILARMQHGAQMTLEGPQGSLSLCRGQLIRNEDPDQAIAIGCVVNLWNP